MPLTQFVGNFTEAASRSRVETIREGLASDIHKAIWRRAAEARLEELAMRESWFGLEPFEENEACQLEGLLSDDAAIQDVAPRRTARAG